MNELIKFWGWLNEPTISVFSAMAALLICILLDKYAKKLYNWLLGSYYYHLLSQDKWEDANMALLKGGKYTIVPPACIGLKSADGDYTNAILEITTGYSTKYDANFKNEFNPLGLAINLNNDQAYYIKVSLDAFLELNKEGAKEIKTTGNIIDIKNIFKKDL